MNKRSTTAKDLATPVQKTDLRRTIRHSLARFLAIFAMTALGALVYVGLKSTPPMMRVSLESRISEASMEPFTLSSPLGLYPEDRERLEQMPGVQQVEYRYAGDFFLDNPESVVRVHSLPEHFGLPLAVEGRLPQKDDEILLDDMARRDGAYHLGDTVHLFSQDAPNEDAATSTKDASNNAMEGIDVKNAADPVEKNTLRRDRFTVVGFARDVHYLSHFRGSSYVGTGTVDYFAFVQKDLFRKTRPDEAALSLAGDTKRPTYDKAYRTAERAGLDSLQARFSDRPSQLQEQIKAEAQKGLDQARQKLDEGWTKLRDAQNELDETRQKLDDGRADYEQGLATWQEQVTAASDELEKQETALTQAENQLTQGEAEYAAGQEAYEAGMTELAAQKNTLDAAKQALDAGDAALQEARARLDAQGLNEETLPQKRNELATAKNMLEDAQKDLDARRAALPDRTTLQQSRQQLEEQRESLTAALQDAQQALASLQTQLQDLRTQLAALDPASEEATTLRAQIVALEAQVADCQSEITQLQDAMAPLQTALSEVEQALAGHAALDEAEASLKEKKATLDARAAALEEAAASLQTLQQKTAELAEKRQEYESGAARYQKAVAELSGIDARLARSRDELSAGHAAAQSGREQLQQAQEIFASKRDEGKASLDAAQETLQEGEAAYAEGLAAFTSEAAEAEPRLSDGEKALTEAQNRLDRIRIPDYAAAGRHNNYSINTFFDQADSLDVLSYVFPTIFYLVALLVSLTTMMRMVDEERTQIGTYKALGYHRRTIRRKYLVYGAISSLSGALIGSLIGFFFLAPTIFRAYASQLYDFGDPILVFHPLYVGIALALCLGVTTFAAWISVQQTLKERAAELMRPKPPANGNRIFWERIRPLWRRLSFMKKVTLRNITAKKGRMFMTIFGVTGCSALIIMGFGIQSSVSGIFQKQFSDIQHYDFQIVYNPDASEEEKADMEARILPHTKDSIRLFQSHGTFRNAKGIDEEFQIIVPQEPDAFSRFFRLQTRRTRQSLALTDDGALVSEKMAHGLHAEKSGTISVKDGDGYAVELPVTGEMENYFNHRIVLTPSAYASFFKKEAVPNTLLLETGGEDLSDELLQDWIDLPAVATVFRMNDTENAAEELIQSLHTIVLVIIVISSLLAIVVLFNLTSLNVSERMRELSTIKVLGFRDFELTLYIYRETFALTLTGIFFGCFVGKAIHYIICLALSPSMVMLDPALPWQNYVLSAFLTVGYSFVIMGMVHRRLKRVDMVEALKAVE